MISSVPCINDHSTQILAPYSSSLSRTTYPVYSAVLFTAPHYHAPNDGCDVTLVETFLKQLQVLVPGTLQVMMARSGTEGNFVRYLSPFLFGAGYVGMGRVATVPETVIVSNS